LIVAEAQHDSAAPDMAELIAAITAELADLWSVKPSTAILTPASPRFLFGG
jgi:hypothetical protein